MTGLELPPKSSERERISDFYLIFVSLVFGVFVSVWIDPVSDLFSPKFSQVQVLEALISQQNFVGIILFLMLICLWWWYGRFLGSIDPATGFFMFAFDFITLGAFAIAFRIWPQPFASPLSVAFAAFLMLVRFSAVQKTLVRMNVPRSSPARTAIRAALVVLISFATVSFFGILGMAGITFAIQNPVAQGDALKIVWVSVRILVALLLICGICVSVYAACITEGFNWGKPRSYDSWLGRRG